MCNSNIKYITMQDRVQQFLKTNPDFAKKFLAMSTEEQLVAVKILKALI